MIASRVLRGLADERMTLKVSQKNWSKVNEHISQCECTRFNSIPSDYRLNEQ